MCTHSSMFAAREAEARFCHFAHMSSASSNKNNNITAADANDRELDRLEEETEKWIERRSKELRSGRKLSKALVFGNRHALDATAAHHSNDPTAILTRYGN